MNETMICPRRYGRTDHMPDRWDTSRWSPIEGEHRPIFPKFPPPRTCSFCGGANPDDLIGLLKLGWEVGETDKAYKRYMHPPGMRMNHERWTSWMVSPNHEGQAFDPLGYVDPNPPVKLYTQHFSAEQVVGFNSILEERYKGLGQVDKEPSS